MKIAVASGKGGTGKTFLATNLAQYLSGERPVVLVDLDVEEPNAGLFFNTQVIHHEIKYSMIPEWDPERCTLCGLCQDLCHFHAIVQADPKLIIFPELCHSCYACSELCPEQALPMKPRRIGILSRQSGRNFRFVQGELDVGQEQVVPLIHQIIQYVDENYPADMIKIYDAPPGTSCPVVEAVKQADYVILVTEPTPFGLHDLKLAVEAMRQLGKSMGVVINREGLGDTHVEEFCQKMQVPILAHIPHDRHIAERYSRGELMDTLPEIRSALKAIEAQVLENEIQVVLS
ncbi:MAG: ATP-binding protein [Candidatus Marinimicrobia bacterium]|nr:ATP-binding protein [Candidatus Neomarinimicrobiota bacterium]